MELIVAGKLAPDGRFQLCRTVYGRVLGLALGDGPNRSILDVRGRIEVRLPGAKADDVPTLSAKPRRTRPLPSPKTVKRQFISGLELENCTSPVESGTPTKSSVKTLGAAASNFQ